METREVEIISAILILPAFLGGLFFSLNFAMATALGGLLMTINFFLLNRGIKRALLDQKRKTKFFIQYAARFVFLVLVIYLVIYFKKINIAGFVVGLSIIFWGIVVSSLKNRPRNT
jgi:hypothetical protein